MRNDSHKTLIGILREHLSAWRKDAGLSSYSAISVIVQAHDEVGGPSATGTDGIAIHNAIKRHKAHVTTIIDSIAASIASLIAVAGDTVQMAENAAMMIHAPWGWTEGNSVAMREYADMLDTWSEAMATSYATKTGGDHAEILALLTDGKDHWYGFICHDSWERQVVEHAAVEARAALPPIEAAPAVLDALGNLVTPAVPASPGYPAIEARAAYTEVVLEAGDRYAFRYDELAMFIAAGQEARLAALEAAP